MMQQVDRWADKLLTSYELVTGKLWGNCSCGI